MSLWLRLKENARQEAERARRLSLDLQRKEDDTSDLRDKLADYKKQIQQVQKEVSKSACRTATPPCWQINMDQSKNSKCSSNKSLSNMIWVLQSIWDKYWVIWCYKMGWSITVNNCQAWVAKLLACGDWHPPRFQFQLSLTKTDLFISNYTTVKAFILPNILHIDTENQTRGTALLLGLDMTSGNVPKMDKKKSRVMVWVS